MKISRFLWSSVYLHQNLSDLLRFCFIGCVKEIWEHYYITTFCECQPFWCEKLKATWTEIDGCNLPLVGVTPGNLIGPSQIELDGRTFISQLHWVSTASLDGSAPGNWIGWSQLPGIESWENVRSSSACNVFKQMPLTPRHSNGPGDLYFQASLGRFCRTISCAHLRTQWTHLRMY